jgi:hypothetical protein
VPSRLLCGHSSLKILRDLFCEVPLNLLLQLRIASLPVERIYASPSLTILAGRSFAHHEDSSQVFRRLAKSPSAVVTVVLSLGLGIAANVVIFSAVNKLVLQGPPVGNPTTLLDIYPTYEHGLRLSKSSMQIYDDLHDEAKSFSGVAAYDNFLPATLGGQVEPERVWGQSATTNFFEVAQLPMTLGRGFYAGEDRSPVIVLSYSLWRRHFNGDPGVVGKTSPSRGRCLP